MHQGYVTITILLRITQLCTVNTNDMPMYNLPNGPGHHLTSYPLMNLDHGNKPLCLDDNKLVECSHNDYDDPDNLKKNYNSIKDTALHLHNLNRINSMITDVQPLLRRILITNMNPIHGRIHPSNMLYPMQGHGYTPPNFGSMSTFNMIMNNPYSLPPLHTKATSFAQPFTSISTFHQTPGRLVPTLAMGVTEPTFPYQIMSSHEKFSRSLDYFERKFYKVTFNKLTSISPPDRRANGMSFVQSGFILQLTLMLLSLEVDSATKAEIDRVLGFRASDRDTLNVIQDVISFLPESSEKLKFRRASRLMLWPGWEVSSKFRSASNLAMQLDIQHFNGTETPAQITTLLNQKIEADSGGAIRDTFDEDDMSGSMVAILTTTLYFRARWRSAPTVLNGTSPFRDDENAPKRTVRMIKLNDIMGYADIKEWNAEAIEIPYAVQDLSLVMLIPRTPSLRRLADLAMNTSIRNITARMRRIRIATTLPLYTLRMTLLMPNKLQEMGITRLFDVEKAKPGDPLRLSHMVQRLMFWAEAGRNAFKDDAGALFEPSGLGYPNPMKVAGLASVQMIVLSAKRQNTKSMLNFNVTTVTGAANSNGLEMELRDELEGVVTISRALHLVKIYVMSTRKTCTILAPNGTNLKEMADIIAMY